MLFRRFNIISGSLRAANGKICANTYQRNEQFETLRREDRVESSVLYDDGRAARVGTPAEEGYL